MIIKDIGHINDSMIGLIIDVAEENFLIKIPTNSNLTNLFNKLPDIQSNNIDEIKNKSIDVVFNSKMTKCSFKKDEYNFDIKKLMNIILIMIILYQKHFKKYIY